MINPATVFAELQTLAAGANVSLSGRHALISEDTPAVRLSSAGWIDLTPAGLIDVTSTELLYGLALEKIMTRISPFSKWVRLFVERYFAFMAARITSLDQPDPTSEIYTREDWIFSTWLPLPHAQILLPPESGQDEPAFAEFDMAFWTGNRLVCVLLAQSGMMLKSKRDKISRLEHSHPQLQIVSVPREAVSDAKPDFPGDLFGEDFINFWRDLELPQGPSPSPVLASAF